MMVLQSLYGMLLLTTWLTSIALNAKNVAGLGGKLRGKMSDRLDKTNKDGGIGGVLSGGMFSKNEQSGLDSHMSLSVRVDYQNEEVRFDRTLNEKLIDSLPLPPFSAMLSLADRDGNSYCTDSDIFGDTKCTVGFDDEIFIDVNASMPEDIMEGSTIEFNLRIDNIIKWDFTCDVCGSECSASLPIIDKAFTFATPECPTLPKSISKSLNYKLPVDKRDTLDSAVRLKVEGTILLTDSTGTNRFQMYLEVDAS
mmetsp:Transcript_26110/g.32029  ORF Transcript_26110/g.32029 Transcript_26110/m.32029 type:complete len:253 (-) Transcript_26110:116-874(-)